VKNKKFLIPLALIAFYFLLTLFKLTALPVFADEAIYIRWGQIIIDDWQRYLFYPMNDGKTPLLMWLIVPFQFIFQNQLLAARIISVIAGAITMIFLGLSSFALFEKKKTAYLTMFLYAILPFTFFYNRLAITDALMLANLTVAYYFSVKLIKNNKNIYIIALTLSFFLALFSKTPALLFIPIFYFSILLEDQWKIRELFTNFIKISISLGLAAGLLYSFRFITPLFPQLFAVGGNFLYPFKTLLTAEIFQIAWNNSRFFSQQFFKYLSIVLIIFALPLYKKTRKKQLILFLSALVFVSPLILLGKIVYPRYLLPTSIFFILSASFSLSQNKHKLINLIAIFYIISFSFKFIYPSYFSVNKIPFSQADRVQFLEEWSSGHGIEEAVEYIKKISQEQTVAVATEGSFGTLPDGILLYFHGEDVSNLYIEGIGQPVRDIPDNFMEKAKEFDRKLLIVNSHRMLIPLPEENLLMEYPRPNNAPSLQIWELK